MKKLSFIAVVALLLSACASVELGLEPPKVEVFGFESENYGGEVPGFRIGVYIRNPNDININPTAIDYRITLEDEVVLVGREVELDRINGLVKAEYIINFRPVSQDDIVKLRTLMSRFEESYDYDLNITASFEGYRREFTARDSGEVELRRN